MQHTGTGRTVRASTPMLERIRFRRWWQPPHPASNRAKDRRITFLELFYDLVYIVIIAELSHALAGNISIGGIGTFVFLFIIVWWAWFNSWGLSIWLDKYFSAKEGAK